MQIIYQNVSESGEEEIDPMSHLEQIVKGWVVKSQFQNDLDWYQRLKEQYE